MTRSPDTLPTLPDLVAIQEPSAHSCYYTSPHSLSYRVDSHVAATTSWQHPCLLGFLLCVLHEIVVWISAYPPSTSCSCVREPCWRRLSKTFTYFLLPPDTPPAMAFLDLLSLCLCSLSFHSPHSPPPPTSL